MLTGRTCKTRKRQKEKVKADVDAVHMVDVAVEADWNEKRVN